MLHPGSGEYTQAAQRYEQSLATFEELGDRQGIANSLGQLGLLEEHETTQPKRWRILPEHWRSSKSSVRRGSNRLGKLYNRLREKMGEADFDQALKEAGVQIREPDGRAGNDFGAAAPALVENTVAVLSSQATNASAGGGRWVNS